VTIKGLLSQGGQLTFSVGKSGQTIAGDVMAAGDSSASGTRTPEYVAPDSNAVTPGTRAAVRSYFTQPRDSGQ
jgi:hypothetical protein